MISRGPCHLQHHSLRADPLCIPSLLPLAMTLVLHNHTMSIPANDSALSQRCAGPPGVIGATPYGTGVTNEQHSSSTAQPSHSQPCTCISTSVTHGQSAARSCFICVSGLWRRRAKRGPEGEGQIQDTNPVSRWQAVPILLPPSPSGCWPRLCLPVATALSVFCSNRATAATRGQIRSGRTVWECCQQAAASCASCCCERAHRGESAALANVAQRPQPPRCCLGKEPRSRNARH